MSSLEDYRRGISVVPGVVKKMGEERRVRMEGRSRSRSRMKGISTHLHSKPDYTAVMDRSIILCIKSYQLSDLQLGSIPRISICN
jgi:hypothetical protein